MKENYSLKLEIPNGNMTKYRIFKPSNCEKIHEEMYENDFHFKIQDNKISNFST